MLLNDIAPRDVLPLCLATLEFFKEYGDRENRSKARLRHIREKLGDEEFKSRLTERFDHLRSSKQWPDVDIGIRQHNIKLLWRLQLPNGNIGLNEAVQLSDVAESKEADLRINIEHGLELFGAATFTLPDNPATLENLPIIIACPGLSSCSKALTDTWAVADAIRKHLPNLNKSHLRINISGCPNSCAHSAIADIGLTGMRRNRDGRQAECFRIFTGGHNGTDNCLAKAGDVIFAEDVGATVKKLLSSFSQSSG
jgi:sulfite reductase beta subunit-like hemoprotein